VKPNKENIITEILIELEKGVERGKCLAKVGKSWQISDRTFDRHWKTANDRHKQTQEATQKALAYISIEAEKERFKKAILTKDESLVLLTEIAMSKKEKSSEKVNAIKAMADLQGWKAPTNSNINLKGSVDVLDSDDREKRIAELVKKWKS
jgi:hypothetical protein